MDQALERLHAANEAKTVLTVFDLRGFSACAAHISCSNLAQAPRRTSNADLPFIRFFVSLMFDMYPKRIGQVLLVGAPLLFQPLWQIVRPLLGRYASIVQFCSAEEAEEIVGSLGSRQNGR